MKLARYFIGALALLAACNPPAPKGEGETAAAAQAAPEIPEPSEEMAATFAACEWGELTAGGLSIWSYACPKDRLVADAALPGFYRETRDENGQTFRHPIIRIFTKPPEALLDAVLEQVRAASPGSEACTIEPGAHGYHVLMPNGAAAAAYQQFIEGKADGPSMPCGPLGPREAGGAVFRLVEGAPDKVVMIDFPSEIAIFDADTLRVAASAP